MRTMILPALFLTACLTATAPLPARAQDGKGLLDLPSGQTLINVSASERTEVRQDLLVISLRYEAENTDSKALQNEINSVMKKALDRAKAEKDVQIATQQYYVYPHDPEPPRPMDGQKPAPQKQARIWRGSQGIELKGTAADTLLTLAGELQTMGLLMSGMNYTISPDLLESTQDSLMEAALGKVKAKAERAAKALGKTQTELLQINIDSGGMYFPQPAMMRGMAMDGAQEKMSMPVAEPGQSEITLTVSAQALIKP